MRRLNTLAARLALLLGVAAALGWGLAGPLSRRLAPPSALAVARGRWAAAAVAHYRLVTLSGNPCRLDVEVRGEDVVQVFQKDPCSYPAQTVTALFRAIERAVSPLYTCAPPSCACRHIVSVYAIYDEQLGYPRKIAVRVDRESNWRTQSFWRYLWDARRLPDCVWSSNADIVEVLAVTPLR